jgi:hypothetical protein
MTVPHPLPPWTRARLGARLRTAAHRLSSLEARRGLRSSLPRDDAPPHAPPPGLQSTSHSGSSVSRVGCAGGAAQAHSSSAGARARAASRWAAAAAPVSARPRGPRRRCRRRPSARPAMAARPGAPPAPAGPPPPPRAQPRLRALSCSAVLLLATRWTLASPQHAVPQLASHHTRELISLRRQRQRHAASLVAHLFQRRLADRLASRLLGQPPPRQQRGWRTLPSRSACGQRLA